MRVISDNAEAFLTLANNRSRSWVAEEGEVFRKGAVLLSQEEMETEYDSEELRREVSYRFSSYSLTQEIHDA